MADEKYKIEIHDYQKLGERIADWANGDRPRPARVMDLIELIENVSPDDGGLKSVIELGPGFYEPAKQLENVTYFDAPDEETISVLIPHPKDLAKPAPPEATYRPPIFYNRLYGHAPNPPADSAVFRSERIGDYAMRKCV